MRTICLLISFIKNYQQCQIITTQFSSEISESCIHDHVLLYENHITAAIAAIEKICDSCKRFIKAQHFQLFQNDL